MRGANCVYVALTVVAPCFAQAPADTTAVPQGATVTVVGEGRVSTRPDVARLDAGVNVAAPTVAQAMQANRQAMERVLASLRQQGVSERDIATSSFSLYVEQQPEAPPPRDVGKAPAKGRQEQYRVTNMVHVTVRQLEHIDAVLDGMTQAGANQMWGVQLVLDDPSQAQAEARRLAAEAARRKAEELASVHGRRLGSVLRITEGGADSPMPHAAREVAMSSVIQPGELEVVAHLQVTYLLLRP